MHTKVKMKTKTNNNCTGKRFHLVEMSDCPGEVFYELDGLIMRSQKGIQEVLFKSMQSNMKPISIKVRRIDKNIKI